MNKTLSENELDADDRNLQEAAYIFAIFPRMKSHIARWEGAFLVTRSEAKRIEAECAKSGRWYGSVGEYFGCYWVWLGKLPKRSYPKCGAATRAGGSCKASCVPGKARCRMHGGLSTGARTDEGRARIIESNRRRAGEKRQRKKLA